MIQAAQLVYSKVEAADSPTGQFGYQTVYYTQAERARPGEPGLTVAEREALEPQLNYPTDGDLLPRRSFCRLGERFVMLQSVPLPEARDHLGRGGIFVTHALVMEPAAFGQLRCDPFAVLDNFPFWTTREQAHDAGDRATGHLPAVNLDPAMMTFRRPAEDLALARMSGTAAHRAAAEWVARFDALLRAPERLGSPEHDEAVARLVGLLRVAYRARSRQDRRRGLVLIGCPEAVYALLRLLFRYLPGEVRAACGFDTLSGGDPRRSGVWAVGLPPTATLPAGLDPVTLGEGWPDVRSLVQDDPVDDAYDRWMTSPDGFAWLLAEAARRGAGYPASALDSLHQWRNWPDDPTLRGRRCDLKPPIYESLRRVEEPRLRPALAERVAHQLGAGLFRRLQEAPEIALADWLWSEFTNEGPEGLTWLVRDGLFPPGRLLDLLARYVRDHRDPDRRDPDRATLASDIGYFFGQWQDLRPGDRRYRESTLWLYHRWLSGMWDDLRGDHGYGGFPPDARKEFIRWAVRLMPGLRCQWRVWPGEQAVLVGPLLSWDDNDLKLNQRVIQTLATVCGIREPAGLDAGQVFAGMDDQEQDEADVKLVELNPIAPSRWRAVLDGLFGKPPQERQLDEELDEYLRQGGWSGASGLLRNAETGRLVELAHAGRIELDGPTSRGGYLVQPSGTLLLGVLVDLSAVHSQDARAYLAGLLGQETTRFSPILTETGHRARGGLFGRRDRSREAVEEPKRPYSPFEMRSAVRQDFEVLLGCFYQRWKEQEDARQAELRRLNEDDPDAAVSE